MCTDYHMAMVSALHELLVCLIEAMMLVRGCRDVTCFVAIQGAVIGDGSLQPHSHVTVLQRYACGWLLEQVHQPLQLDCSPCLLFKNE